MEADTLYAAIGWDDEEFFHVERQVGRTVCGRASVGGNRALLSGQEALWCQECDQRYSADKEEENGPMGEREGLTKPEVEAIEGKEGAAPAAKSEKVALQLAGKVAELYWQDRADDGDGFPAAPADPLERAIEKMGNALPEKYRRAIDNRQEAAR